MLRIFLVVFSVVLSTAGLYSQTYESFYSRSGIGDNQEYGNVQMTTTGWLKSTTKNPYYVNYFNPSSYAKLSATAIDIGFDVSRNRVSLENESRNFWQGNINYLSLSFPLINPLNKVLDREVQKLKLGMNLAIVPVSRVGYETTIRDNADYLNQELPYWREYSGQGGLSRFITGVGAEYEDFSFGVNLGYTFGTIQYEQAVAFPLGLDFLSDYYDLSERYSGFYYRMGAMYDYYLHRDKEDPRNNVFLTFGLTYQAQQRTKVKYEESQFKYRTANFFNLPSGIDFIGLDEIDNTSGFEDTVGITSVTNHTTLPSQFGIGLTYYYKNKMKLGLDIETTAWSNYKNESRPEDLENSFKISAGMEYIPNESSYTNGWQRIRYRGGLKYETDPRTENGVQLKQYGVNLGIGVPIYFSRQVSFINLGIGYNHIEADISSSNNLRFEFGFTLNNNLWFYKRRFD